MKRMKLLLILIPFLCHCGSSGGTDSGNPDKISLNIISYRSSDFQQIAVNGLTLNTAQVVLDRIRFRSLNECDDEFENASPIEFGGPFIIDLLQPSSLVELDDLDVPAGTYCSITLRFKKIAGNPSTENVIVGRSVYIEGERGDGTPFQVELTQDEDFELQNDANGFLVDNAESKESFFIAFDLEQWFNSVNLNHATTSSDSNGDPIIFISAEQNSNIQEQIIDNIQGSADLLRDENNDQELDEEELEPSLAQGKEGTPVF